MRRTAGTRFLAPAALLCVIAAVVISMTGGDQAHTLRAAFTSAVQVVPGQDVRIAGHRVGSVDKVALTDGQAVLTLKLDDGSSWPLHRGTVARLNFGLPASYASRFVELFPGPASQPELRDGGILTTADTITPVEFDQLYRIFGPRTRANFQALLDNASTTLDGHTRDLGNAFGSGSRGLRSLAATVGELGADPTALGTLVTAAAQTSGALARQRRALGGLIDDTAATFDELQANAGALQQTLDRLPDALHEGSHTLGRLDTSLVSLQALVDDLRPGASALAGVAPTLRHALATLRVVAPQLERSLRSGSRQLPALTAFVTRTTPFLVPASHMLERVAPMLGCVRAYSPEIAGFLGTWLSFNSNYDNVGHYARGSNRVGLINPGTQLTTAQTIKEHPQGALTYAMPRPPGMNAGKPWFLPECGITKDALDPSKDPETRR